MNRWMIITMATLVVVLDIRVATGDDGGCEPFKEEGIESLSGDITIPEMTWIETPSIITKQQRQYQVLGRVVHMKYIKEHLASKEKVKFGDSQKEPNNIQLEVWADTVYIEGVIEMRGIKKLTVYSRKVVSEKDSQLDVRAPTLRQEFESLAPGAPGVPGLNGVPGPKVEVFTKVSKGYLYITSDGGNGNQGQPGADGKDAPDDLSTKTPRTFTDCKNNKCKNINGIPGDKGKPGGDGGNAGKPGDGGDAGKQRLYVQKIIGNVELKTSPGQGATAVANGKGGEGGEGSKGGTGYNCYKKEEWSYPYRSRCIDRGATGSAADGVRGEPGRHGQTPMVSGSNGQVAESFVRKCRLSDDQRSQYPLALLKLMKRHAEDRIWANDVKEGKRVLEFLILLMRKRQGVKDMRADSKRRLGFLGKEGYDRFGNNKGFAPLMRWERLKKHAEDIATYAKSYESAYNGIQSSVRQQEEITKVLKDIVPKTARIQVKNEIKRQDAARKVDESQKRLYTESITQIEGRMGDTLMTIKALHLDLESQFNLEHLFAILQGITGFVGGVAGKDPGAAISGALSIIEAEATRCNRGTLRENKDKIKKWLTFGKAYKALTDSSQLNFDEMDVQSVPEIMKANLEMNKEGIFADLVCLLEVDLKEHKTAKLKEQMERFFIDGATRIDLIAQVMELDNNIGTYNYDIANLRETARQIQTVSKSKGTPIADSIRQEFVDNLLNVYEELETRFAKQVYLFYKGFQFRTLWNVDKKMETFQSRAASLAKGTGNLQGVTTIEAALHEITNIEKTARTCFTGIHHRVGIKRWSFDSTNNARMFEELHKGSTEFSLDISKGCADCYNVRLLKFYVELYGATAQPSSIPDRVRLKLRPMGSSYFRSGNKEVKVYHQARASPRYLSFDRFKITDATKCREEKEQGRPGGFYCMTEQDQRLTAMCCHPLSNSPCEKDALMGEEECRSVFGTYEISIPINPKLECGSTITYKNCKDLKRELFTHMNVWTTFMYWPEKYPSAPEDPVCKITKRNATAKAHVPLLKSRRLENADTI